MALWLTSMSSSSDQDPLASLANRAVAGDSAVYCTDPVWRALSEVMERISAALPTLIGR